MAMIFSYRIAHRTSVAVVTALFCIHGTCWARLRPGGRTTSIQAADKGCRTSVPDSAPGIPVVRDARVPAYPFIALAAGIQGRVLLRITVQKGRVVSAKPVEKANPQLVSAALKNVKTWRFKGTVNTTITVTFEYLIEGIKYPVLHAPVVVLKLPGFVRVCSAGLKIKPTVMY